MRVLWLKVGDVYMTDYSIHFDASDVVRTLKRMYDRTRSLSLEDRSDEIARITHNSTSPCSGMAYAPTIIHRTLAGRNTHHDILQYAERMKKAVEHSSFEFRELFNELGAETFPSHVIEEHSQQWIVSLTSLIEGLPFESHIDGLDLSEYNKRTVRNGDICTSIFLYSLNSIFGDGSIQKKYSFRTTMKDFTRRQGVLFRHAGVIIVEKFADYFLSSHDYVENVVVPLALNCLDHAFDGVSSEKKNVYIGGKVSDDFKLYTITVEDNGKGINPDILPRLFERGASTKKDAGSPHGIGLAGVKSFVESCGGTISVETSPEKGSKFIVSVPYER